MDLVTYAKTLSLLEHEEDFFQGVPYSKILEETAEILRPFGEIAETCAWLHAILETEMVDEELEREFPPPIPRLVKILERDLSLPMDKRNEKLRIKLKLLPGEGEESIPLLIYCAVRLSKIRICREKNRDLLKIYKEEHRSFMETVYRASQPKALWKEMQEIYDSF